MRRYDGFSLYNFMASNQSRLVVMLANLMVLGLRYYRIKKIMVLAGYVISQDQVIKASCDFMGKSSSR